MLVAINKQYSMSSLELVEDNLIHSLKFDIELSRNNLDFSTISDVEEYCQQKAIPIIEEIIENCGKENDVIENSVVLELGEMTKDEFESKLTQLLKEKLFAISYESFRHYDSMAFNGNSLTSILKDKASCHEFVSLLQNDREAALKFLQESNPKEWKRIVESDKSLEINRFPFDQTGNENIFIFDYLSREIIPWVEDAQNFDPEIFIANSLANILNDNSSCQAFVSFLQSDRVAALRFIHESNPKDLVRIAESIKKQIGIDSHKFLEFKNYLVEFLKKLVPNRSGDADSSIELVRSILEESEDLTWLLAFLYSTNSSKESEKIINGANGEVGTSLLLENIIRVVTFSLIQGDNDSYDNILCRIHGRLIGKFEEIKRCSETACEDEEKTIMNSVIQNSLDAELNEMSLNTNSCLSSEKNVRIHVFDAGLILLHPFLPSFLQKIGLVNDRHKFISKEAKHRAVHLLRYMAGAELRQDSCQLALEKMVCGLPVDALIGRNFEISDMEKEEIVGLFEAVKEYWKPVSKSSMESIQHTFLQRHGTIEFSDSAWIVRVEGNAFDILLEDLPWEISTILFPWLEDLIFVEWQQE